MSLEHRPRRLAKACVMMFALAVPSANGFFSCAVSRTFRTFPSTRGSSHATSRHHRLALNTRQRTICMSLRDTQEEGSPQTADAERSISPLTFRQTVSPIDVQNTLLITAALMSFIAITAYASPGGGQHAVAGFTVAESWPRLFQHHSALGAVRNVVQRVRVRLCVFVCVCARVVFFCLLDRHILAHVTCTHTNFRCWTLLFNQQLKMGYKPSPASQCRTILFNSWPRKVERTCSWM